MLATAKIRPENRPTRDALLEAGKQVFSAKGYHATNVSDIVAAVGMAQGSFYNYFKNKRAIFEELLQSFADKVIAAVENVDLDSVKDEISYYSVGMSLGTTVSTIFMAEKELARIFFWEAVGLDADMDQALDDTFRRITAGTQAYIERGKKVGIVRDDISSKITAAAMVGMCSHLISRYFRNDFDDVPPDEVLRTLVTIHLRVFLTNKS
jgi:AcrR family transcriptional regulator